MTFCEDAIGFKTQFPYHLRTKEFTILSLNRLVVLTIVMNLFRRIKRLPVGKTAPYERAHLGSTNSDS